MDVSSVTLDGDPEGPLGPLAHEALRWVMLVTSSEATEADARMAAAWRAQGPAHDAAFREAAALQRLVRATGLPPPSGQVVPFPQRRLTTARPPSRRAVMFGGGGIAAGLAGWMIIRPPMGLWPSLAELTADHHTGVGQRQHFTLARGTSFELNGRSAVSIADQGRGLDLVDGEVFVTLQGDASAPLTIRAGDLTVALHGGGLDVRTSARETCATCLGGVATARVGDSPIRLAAGQAVTMRAGGPASVAAVDPTTADAWRRGLLIFQDTPLAEAVEAINRYRNGRIILANDALAEQPVNGIYHTDGLEGIVAHLQALLHVRVTRLPGNVAILA